MPHIGLEGVATGLGEGTRYVVGQVGGGQCAADERPGPDFACRSRVIQQRGESRRIGRRSPSDDLPGQVEQREGGAVGDYGTQLRQNALHVTCAQQIAAVGGPLACLSPVHLMHLSRLQYAQIIASPAWFVHSGLLTIIWLLDGH